MKKRYRIWITGILLTALLLCACGRKEESTEENTEATSAVMTVPTESGSETQQPSSKASLETPDPAAEAPEEDPWAEGYFYDAALSAALWECFATDNTNNTDRTDPSRTMSEDFLAELDRRAAAWLWEGISDGETEHAMLALSFRYPDDPPGTERGMKSVKASVYSLKGRDPDGLAARIRLGNTEACFYLFLRAYYSPNDDRTRVYMINGLIW